MKLTTSAARPRSAIDRDQVADEDDDVYLLGHFVVRAVAMNEVPTSRPVRFTSRPTLNRSGTEPWYTIGTMGLTPLMLWSLKCRPAAWWESPKIGPMTLPVSE